MESLKKVFLFSLESYHRRIVETIITTLASKYFLQHLFLTSGCCYNLYPCKKTAVDKFINVYPVVMLWFLFLVLVLLLLG